MRITITVDDKDYDLIEHRARKNGLSLSEAAKTLIKNGLLFEVPERKSQIAMACAIESLLLQRKLAERTDTEWVKAANQEAQKMVESILLKEESR